MGTALATLPGAAEPNPFRQYRRPCAFSVQRLGHAVWTTLRIFIRSALADPWRREREVRAEAELLLRHSRFERSLFITTAAPSPTASSGGEPALCEICAKLSDGNEKTRDMQKKPPQQEAFTAASTMGGHRCRYR